jgi:tetratricopeptide (TPR) repeat protein
VKRNISLLLLKGNKYEEALDELIEVEELEKTLYGDTSLQLGKTYKVIGTLYIINNKPQEAKDYLNRAIKIFEIRGNMKLLKEVRGKMKMLTSSIKMAQEQAIMEERHNIDDDSDDDGSGKKAAFGKGKKKPKKGKKGKGRMAKNNFMGDDDL